MDLPVVETAEQKRPSLKADAISKLIQASSDQEQALYVLLAATGLRVSEPLAVETRHFTNDGRTITVEQQVEKDSPTIVALLPVSSSVRSIGYARKRVSSPTAARVTSRKRYQNGVATNWFIAPTFIRKWNAGNTTE